jgi:hypothetical protein
MVKQLWARAGVEPRLAEVLADPIVVSLMRADHITRTDVLTASAGLIDRQRGHEELRASA